MAAELAAALVKAQAAMPPVAKDATNPHYRTTFASLDNIIETTRPVLNKHGLSIHQFPAVSDIGAPTLVTVLMHISGERIEYAAPLFLQGQDMQKYGAALTYARRYAWAAALGIATDEDDDGHTAARPAATGETRQEEPPSQFTPPAGATNGTKVITEAQAKRLWAIARQHGRDEDTVKDIVSRHAGELVSTKEIPREKYDAIIADLEARF